MQRKLQPSRKRTFEFTLNPNASNNETIDVGNDKSDARIFRVKEHRTLCPTVIAASRREYANVDINGNVLNGNCVVFFQTNYVEVDVR